MLNLLVFNKDLLKMKLVSFLFLATAILMFSCNEGTIVEQVDPSIQRAIDIEIINDYLTEKGYDPATVDTTESGVRYIIIDEGQTSFDSLSIDESDIVDFDYIGRLTNGALFDTSIEAVAQEDTAIFSEFRNYVPLLMNYSSTGWTIRDRFVSGFAEGISITFNKVHVGAHILIAFPSDLGYGATAQFGNGVETIPANSVLTFELFPVRVTKQ
jgi:hypothetical protein